MIAYSMYVKWLGREILDWKYFSEVVCCNEGFYHTTTGFLVPYARIIEHLFDLNILVDKCVTWHN
jgi:hypothetical protein